MSDINETDQIGMDETILEDPELEEALEDRAEALEEARPYNAAVKEANKRVKALADEEGRVPIGGPVRIGRFRVTRAIVEARHVEFDTDPGTKLDIAAGSE